MWLLTIRNVFLITQLQFIVNQVNTDEISYEHNREYRVIEGDDTWYDLMKDWHENDAHVVGRLSSLHDLVIPTIKEIEEYIKTFEPAFKSTQKYIKNIVKTSAVLTGRIKKPYSIQGKLEKKNITLQNLTDIIGLRLTCQTVNGSLQIASEIKKDKDNFDILEEKCYGMCPGAGKYKPGGYRRIHLILNIKPENKSAELQIGTPYTSYWSDWNHDFIYKGPPEITNRSSVQKYSIAMADYFLRLDTDRDAMPTCPKILQNANALDLLKESLPEEDATKMYNKLGQPPNACFWWYDMKLALPEETCLNPQKLIYFTLSNLMQRDTAMEINGGHTREYILLDDDDNDWKNLINHWYKETISSPYAMIVPTIKEIERYIKTLEPAFTSAQKYIKNIVKTSAVLTGRLKKPYSIQGKLKKYNITLQNLTDIIGLRLTCQSVNESVEITSAIKKDKANFDILEEKCYGMCPGAGKYKPEGYRRIHLIINIKPANKSAELQIGTPYTNYWSDWSHDFLYKGSPKIANNTQAKNYSLQLADYFLKSDTDRDMTPRCPEYLEYANAFTILRHSLPPVDALKMFKKLGQPPNACFWWYDMKLALPEKDCGTTPSNSRILKFELFLTISSILLTLCILRI